MTDANGVTVSNGYADNNAPYDVATKTIANKRFQKVILYDGSGNEVTSWTITPSGTQDINLKQVGGAAFAQGQRTGGQSISVVSADAGSQGAFFQPDGLVQGNDVIPVGVWSGGAGQWVAWSGNVSTDVTTATTPAYGKIAGSSLTTSFQTVLSPGGNPKTLHVWNSTEVPVIFSFDGGTTNNLELGPYESYSEDFAANNLQLASGTIQAKLVSGSAPVNGGSVRAKVTR